MIANFKNYLINIFHIKDFKKSVFLGTESDKIVDINSLVRNAYIENIIEKITMFPI